MYSEQLENLISAALTDGELTEKKKQILFRRAEAEGVDLDEFEMVLDSRIFAIKKEEAAKEAAAQAAAAEATQATAATAATEAAEAQKEAETQAAPVAPVTPVAPKSNKFGDVRKCPACGAILQSFQTSCPDCGYELKNIESVQSAQMLFEQLQAVDLRKSDNMLHGEAERQRRLNEKLTIIKTFPVPNTKEDLLELLAMAASNAYNNDGYVGPEEEVWIQKADHIYQKIIVCATNDKPFLAQATNMIVSLMKRLPLQYKKFTHIPSDMVGVIQENLQQEQDAKKQLLVETFKKWGSISGGCFVVSFFAGLVDTDITSTISFLGFIAGCVTTVMGVRSYKRQRDIF